MIRWLFEPLCIVSTVSQTGWPVAAKRWGKSPPLLSRCLIKSPPHWRAKKRGVLTPLNQHRFLQQFSEQLPVPTNKLVLSGPQVESWNIRWPSDGDTYGCWCCEWYHAHLEHVRYHHCIPTKVAQKPWFRWKSDPRVAMASAGAAGFMKPSFWDLHRQLADCRLANFHGEQTSGSFHPNWSVIIIGYLS